MSYMGSTAPDLEAKNRSHHRQFRDRRDGYESEEGEMLKKSKPRGEYDGPPDPRRRDHRDPHDSRGPPRGQNYDEEPRRRRHDRDYDDDRDPPAKHGRRRDYPEVQYGADPIPAVKRSNTERPDRRRPKPRRDYDDESSEEDDRDRRRPPPRRRRSQDDTRHRSKRDYDDDRDDYRDDRDRDRRRGDRDRDDRRRDKSRDRDRRSRYSDEESDYGGSRRDRDRDRDRRRGSSAPPKEVKIGDYDIGPMLEKGKKHYGTIAPILAPIAMNMARKYLSGSKR